MKAQNHNPLNQLKSPVNISKLPANSFVDYELTKDQDWVRELLVELNEKASVLPEGMKLDQTRLDITFEIQRRFKGEYGEFVLCKGQIDAVFFTECIKTLATMKDTVTCEFKAMFLDSSFAEKPEYEELTESYFDQEIYDLYFFDRRMVNLKEMLHEVIWLNLNPYPVRD